MGLARETYNTANATEAVDSNLEDDENLRHALDATRRAYLGDHVCG